MRRALILLLLAALPATVAAPGAHALRVMVRNDGHDWDLDTDDDHKDARGPISASIDVPGGRSFAVPNAARGTTPADPCFLDIYRTMADAYGIAPRPFRRQ